MKRRALVAKSMTLAVAGLAGCSSSESSGTETTDESVGNQTTAENSENKPTTESSDNDGARGPEDAVTFYNSALDLLEQNAEELDEARQELIETQDVPDFDATGINSRISEARRLLERAESSDDGSLSDEIEALRTITSYQETVVEYNEAYLSLVELIGTGLDEYNDGRHESAIEVLEDANQQIEPTNSLLEEVSEKLDETINSVEQSDIDDSTVEQLILLDEQNKETQIEITIMEHLIPARMNEIEGDLYFQQGYNAIENESYDDARSHFSNAWNLFDVGITELEKIDVNQNTAYIESLINNVSSLICEYEYSKDAADDLEKAVDAAQSGDSAEAEEYLDEADSNISKIDTCW